MLLVCFLVLLSFTDLPLFCLVFEAFIQIVGLTLGLVICVVKSISGKVAIGLFGWLQ